ncbi:hypothetical protein [Nocardioides sp. zg-DK7169]|uniref:hypothetical protein n=1 Tax=Nocardioides sp. zg-DK7169 TaxID=2736600 RepID=UPI0015542527|nr:hypothetical protein [Nocardioides sp. zg-DK7169]NPC95902.1 hypothetical protein [Nocardioides sp. zg-DK7169]
MSDRIYLHIGVPKSGTSYVQRRLLANKEQLAQEAGLLFPGKTWGDQVLAVRDLRGIRGGRERRGAWNRLRKEMAAWSGSSVVSMEWLCAADEETIARIVADVAPAQVEVVITARDLGRTVAAAWQEYLQNRREWTWEDFLAQLGSEQTRETAAGSHFWAQQDLTDLVTRWSGVVGPEHTHVVTLPHPGADPDVLWQRMAEVLGFDPARFAAQGERDANESLGLESAEVMRRVNPLTRRDGLGYTAYRSGFKQALGKDVLAHRRSLESRVAVPEDQQGWIREVAARHIASVASSGVHLVGDLTDLEPVFAPGRQPSQVPAEEILDTAAEALNEVSQRWLATRTELRRLQARHDRLSADLEAARARVAELEAHPVRFAVGRRTDRARRLPALVRGRVRDVVRR